MLLEHAGQIVTREELRNRLWPSDTFVDFDHSLNKVMNKLREALGDSADSPRFIETLARRGYRFIGDLAVSPGRIESLAVLPLENLSGDPEQQYFADGMTEALITTLAKIGALRVVSRTTAMHYKGVHQPLREIAQQLHVDAFVEGTVLRSGTRVRISAQLVDAHADTHLWAESYDRDLRDVLALQAEVARAVASEIQVKLTPQEQVKLAQSRRVDPKAYEAYLKGRYHWNKRSLEGMSKGLEYFQQAIERDPQYAAAYAGLADSASRLGFWGHVRPEEGCARGITAALKTLEFDNMLADAPAALGFSLLHYDCSFVRAEEECRRAVELDPRSPFGRQGLACCLITSGRLEEGASEALRAAELDPLSLILQWSASALIYYTRQYDRAISEARKCLELEPSFPHLWWTIALSLAKKRRAEAGIEELEGAVRAARENQLFLAALGHCYAVAGRRADALRVLDRFRELSRERPYGSANWPAAVCASLGERDEALRLLEVARKEPSPWMPYVKVAPFFDDLRSDTRFQDMLRSMNFPEV